MRRRLLASVALLAALGASLGAHAERLTPERAFGAPDLSGPTAEGVQLSPDGKLVTFLRAKAEDRTVQDLWAMPTGGGEPRRLVDAYAVAPKSAALSEAEKSRRERERISAQGVVEYTWDEQGRDILVPAGGDLYLADAASGQVSRLTQTPGDETDARFSPKGRFVSYVRDKTLYVMDLTGRRERAVTPQGAGAVSYATAAFVDQEEIERFTGYWWSPDERRIAWTKVDESGVDLIPRLEIGAEGSRLEEQRYPKAGRPNAREELYVSSPDGGSAPVKVDLGPDSDIYLARVDWSTDGRTVYVQRESRDQSRLDLLAVDPATGAARVIETERGQPWVDLNDNFKPLHDGSFLWTSQRTGFSHIYLFDRDGRVIRQVTHGDWPAAVRTSAAGSSPPGLEAVDEARGLVYFVGSKDTPLEHQLYVTSYRTPGEPTALTHGHGWWEANVAKDAGSFVATYSDPATPPQTALYGIDGTRRRWVEENRLGPGHPYYPYLDQHVVPEFGRITAADGRTPLDYLLMKPKDFRAGVRYPVIVNVYGGPDSLDIKKSWRSPTQQLWLQRGFVIFQLANRGGANRGVAFASALAGHLGGVEVEDQLEGLKFLRSQPYVDPDRIGISGWSYGGYMTLRMLTEPRAHLKAGAAGAPPTDWRQYDTHYTERFMGMPELRAAAYDQSADLPRLPELARPGAGRLLLMQGMADDNVLFTNSILVMDRLQGMGTPFDLMLYPGQRHGIRTPERQLQLWRTQDAFFERELGRPEPVKP
jgi:dipeptidyl-peptidase 4